MKRNRPQPDPAPSLATPEDILAAFQRLAAANPSDARYLQLLISGTEIGQAGMSMADEQAERERIASEGPPHRGDAPGDGITTLTFPAELVAAFNRGEVGAEAVQRGARRGGRT